jgi:hypothetical protein
MRSKYFSLLALVLSLIVMGVVAWFEVSVSRPDGGRAGVGPIAPLSDIPVPAATVLEQMDRLERRMHLLAAPPPGLKTNADLTALGYVPMITADPGGFGDQNTKDKDYRLTMAFNGRVKRYCIIDDHLYAEGAELPDGARILSIESKRVLIDKASIQQWLEIVPLLDSELPEES